MNIYYCPSCLNEVEADAAECPVCMYVFRGEHDDEPTGAPLSPAEVMAAHIAEFGR
jgi:hypothetical protein